jgi:ABC-type branched-subunit amino acid transport system substrate-binding protein
VSTPTKSLPILLAIAILASGCTQTRRPLTPDVPTTGDTAAQERFRDARAKFERDEYTATEDFEAIARDFPDDPIAPYARLYAGMSALRDGAHADAVAHLEALEAIMTDDRGLEARGKLFLGVAYTYEGDFERALPRLAESEPALHDDDERGEWLAALAEAHAHTGGAAEAIDYYDAWYGLATSPEQAYIVERLGALAGLLSDADLSGAYDDVVGRGGPGAAIVGERYATALEADGEMSRAEDVRKAIAKARRALGFAESAASAAEGDTRLVGALIPLSGSQSRVGDLVMRGIVLASGTFTWDEGGGIGMTGVPQPFRVSLRDTGSQSSGVAAALDELVAEEVIAVLGPVDARSAAAAAEAADRLGLPIVTLAPRSQGGVGSRHVFYVVHSAEDRARLLARHAIAVGVRDVAIFAPRNGYGRAVGRAFRDEIVKLGGQVTVQADYPADARSFVEEVKALRGPWEAVFVPDQARRLELIAPALAAANFVSTPIDARPPRHGRKVLLLSTAEFLAPGYLRSTGRYSRGAVFAPGFYPDRTDAEIGRFVDRYEQTFGRTPTTLDAYAYDAALAVRAAVESGARTRAEVGAAMLRGVVSGVTGRVGFDSARERAGTGVLYTVAEDDDGSYRVRALRD